MYSMDKCIVCVIFNLKGTMYSLTESSIVGEIGPQSFDDGYLATPSSDQSRIESPGT